MTSIQVEIIAGSVDAAVAAERGGASRIELCSSLHEGGLTPEPALIESVRAAVSFGVYVMIRPRAGDFYYDVHEFEIMQRDIALAKERGADGVVFGILNAHAQVDVERTRQLIELARPLEVTFHRAFDKAADLKRALDDICECGADRLLTSGGKKTAWEGRTTIAQLVKQALGRIAIMAGSGVKPENAATLVAETGVQNIHASLRPASSLRSCSTSRSDGGTSQIPEPSSAALEADVRKLCQAVNNGNAARLRI